MIQIDMSIINEKDFPYLNLLDSVERERLHDICAEAIAFGHQVNAKWTAALLGLPDCARIELSEFLDRVGVPRRRNHRQRKVYKVPRGNQAPTPTRFEPAPGEIAKLHTVVFASAIGTNEV